MGTRGTRCLQANFNYGVIEPACGILTLLDMFIMYSALPHPLFV